MSPIPYRLRFALKVLGAADPLREATEHVALLTLRRQLRMLAPEVADAED